MSTMDGDQSSRFVSSLVKSIQALCNGYIDFSSSIEVIGHIHLNIDRSVKLDYVLTEEVSKSVSEGATVFASHSYHSQPPSSAVSKNASDSSSSNRNRSKQSQGDDGESAGFRSSTTDVHTPSKSDSHAQKRSSGHYGENSESSHSGSFVNTGDMLSLKQESPQKLCRTPESLDRRRKSAHGPQSQFHHHSPSPAVKRSRHSDSIPEREPQDFEVIEIKEEPDEAPAVFFGNSSSHMAAGQDLQTPDFSSVVMESLDRVSQVEGTDLVGEGGSMQQPFPVMMHSNPGMSSSSSSLAGPSQSDPQSQSLASTSGIWGPSKAAAAYHSSSQRPNLPSSEAYSGGRLKQEQHMWGRPQGGGMPGRERSGGGGRGGGGGGLGLGGRGGGWMGSNIPFYLIQSRLKKQYSPQQLLAAMADVDAGRSVSEAAREHGVPVRTLYRKLNNRNSHGVDGGRRELSPMLPVHEPFGDENGSSSLDPTPVSQ